ncbi:MAG: DNA polymerase-4 [Cellvibrionaceae bacterium]|jgi:DNA polymerase-4
MVWTRAIIHLDMDAFFVNVHLLEHPEDRGKPIAVGGSPTGRGVVASASYEARQFGVHSAMPSSRALRLCPNIKFVRHNWNLIKETSSAVMAVLGEYGPLEKMSVDEAYVDVSHYPDPESVALIMRERVKFETSCPASVGLATSKLVAKIASDYDKPEGCTIVLPGDEASFMAPLPVRAISGIGPATAAKLAAFNIETCGQLADSDFESLQSSFKNQAESLLKRAKGIDHRKVEADPGQSKSISQENTFNNDVDDRDYLYDQIKSMSESISQSLRRKNLIAHTVQLKFRWDDFTTFTRQRSVENGIDSAREIERLAIAVFDGFWEGEKLRLIGVGASNIIEPTGRQLELFPDLDLSTYS